MSTPNKETTLPEHIRVREVWTLAWPMIVGMLSYTFMALADTVYVALLGGDDPSYVGAVGLAAVTLFTFHALGSGILSGVKVTVAQSTGAGDHAKTKLLAWQGVWLAVGLGIAEAALALISDPLFAALASTEAVSDKASTYFAVRALSGPFAFGWFAFQAYFQGRGDTRTPMVAALVANLSNIALDPLFIFGLPALGIPGLGVAGAAWATVLSMAVGCGFMAYKTWPHLRGVSPALRPDLMRWITRIGLPIGVRGTLEVGSFTVFSAVLSAAGEADLAAHIMVVRIISVSFLPGYGMHEAAAVLVGQAVGARRPELARQTFTAALQISMAIMVGCGVFFLLIPELLLAPFSPGPEVQAIGIELLWVAAAFQIFDALAMVAQGALNGAGDTRFVMVSGVTTAWLVKLPLGYGLAIGVGLGALGAWVGLLAEIIVIAVICYARVRGTRWLRAAGPEQAPKARDRSKDGRVRVPSYA